jgi:hypothetical protein
MQDILYIFTDEIRRQWEEYVTLIEPLSAPIYHTTGNHDIWIDGTDASVKLYKEFIGDLNYSFDHHGVHFVVMDNSRWEKIDELPQETIEWLTNDLQDNRDALYILVFYHIPFWFESLAQGLPDKLHDIFKEYGVDAVFTGHYHEYFADEYDGIIYTSIGSSGGIASLGVTGLLYHFPWVTIDKDGIGFFLVPPHGEGAFNNYQIYFNPNGTIFDRKITIEIENKRNENRKPANRKLGVTSSA